MSSYYREQAQYPASTEEKTTSSSSDDEIQATLGVLYSPSCDYLIQSFLGEGSFGKVAKCVKSATKETVAVKIMKANSVSLEAQNEVNILQQLRAFDPDRFNFVKYNDAFIDRNHICLEFEMLDVSLFDFVERKPSHSLTVKEIRPILHQMATTLQLLRNLGVAHTDLKPDNIMMVHHINQPLKIKMIDFGLACSVSQTTWGTYMQPRCYRSPEVILGSPLSTAIDMWSLGCIAAELFLGFVLYPGSCEYDMLQHIVQTQGQLPRQLLNCGIKTRHFFRRMKGRRRQWRLKTPFEYGHQVTRSPSYFSSLDDLKEIRPVCHLSDEDTMAEIYDQENFVDLLKKMLHLDVGKRITPSQLHEDPFITMSDLADTYPNSFYVKSGYEMMEVCQDQQSRLYPQASTSTASLHQHNILSQVSPAWYSHQEHPLVLGIASTVGSLSILEDQSPEPQQLSSSVQEEKTLLQLPSEAQSYTGKVRPARKMKRDSFEASQSGDRSPESALPESKRMKMDFKIHSELSQTSEEAPAEASSSTATAKPQRKRRKEERSPHSSSPEEKKTMMSLLRDSKEAPIEAPSDVADIKPQRKRTWATFVASHSELSPYSSSPERKKRKMSLAETLIKKHQNANQAPSSEGFKEQHYLCPTVHVRSRRPEKRKRYSPETVAQTKSLRKRKV